MSKSGKSEYFRHVFANNFFGIFFKNFFNGFDTAWNSAFFDTQIEFLKKIFFFALISIFFYFECKCAREGTKKRKNSSVLEFN